MKKKAAVSATICVAVSAETQKSVVDYYGVSKVITISNAIDTNEFIVIDKSQARKKIGLPEGKKIIFFASRLGSQKGANIIHGIAKKIRDTKRDIIVVGAAFGHKFPEESGIIGLDNFSYEQLVNAYNASDVFLLPSRHEGSSLALLEAMACGLPFLASPVGLIPELQGKGLFKECIVKDQKVDAYISQLDILLALSNEHKKELSEQLRNYILENHSLQAFEDRYYSLIKEIANL